MLCERDSNLDAIGDTNPYAKSDTATSSNTSPAPYSAGLRQKMVSNL